MSRGFEGKTAAMGRLQRRKNLRYLQVLGVTP